MNERMTERLGAKDWIAEGFRALTEEGPSGLKAERLATRLKVSRGSFYWHFENVGAFHTALLEAWRRRETESVIDRLAANESASERILDLMRRAMRADHSLERALRAWATENSAAEAAIREVDRRRTDYLESQFGETGFSEEASSALARFVYWGHLGRTMTLDLARSDIDAEQIELIVKRLLENEGG